MNIYMLYETFKNFISTVMRYKYYDYIGKIWNKLENIIYIKIAKY